MYIGSLIQVLAIGMICIWGGLTLVLLALMLVDIGRRLSGRRLRRALGREVTSLEANPTESYVVLRGRLRRATEAGHGTLQGVAAATVVDGSAAGRWSPDQPLSARLDGLDLEVGDALVRLEGTAEVILGSREADTWRMIFRSDEARYRRAARTFPGLVPAMASQRKVLQSLDLGDEVVAAGWLDQRGHPDGRAGYRQSAHRWVLSGGRGGQSLLAATKAPTRPLSPAAVAIGALYGALAVAGALWLAGWLERIGHSI